MAIMEGLLCYDINRKKWGSRLQPLGTLLMRIHLLWSLTCHQMRWRIAYVEFEPTVFSKLSYNLLCGLGRPRKLFGWRCFAQVQTDPFSAIQYRGFFCLSGSKSSSVCLHCLCLISNLLDIFLCLLRDINIFWISVNITCV